jgi:hypothetical protein
VDIEKVVMFKGTFSRKIFVDFPFKENGKKKVCQIRIWGDTLGLQYVPLPHHMAPTARDPNLMYKHRGIFKNVLSIVVVSYFSISHL